MPVNNGWEQFNALLQMAQGLVEDAERDVETLERIYDACNDFDNIGGFGIDVDEDQRPWRITVSFTVTNLDSVLEEETESIVGTPLADLWELSNEDQHTVTYDGENHWWQGEVTIEV